MLTKGQRVEDQIERNWVVLSNPTSAEHQKLINELGLPSPFFERKQEKEMASFHSYYTSLNEEGFILHIPLWKGEDFSSLSTATHSLTSYFTSRMILIWTEENHHEQAVSAIERTLSPINYIYDNIMEEYAKLSLVLDKLQKRIVDVENQTKLKANRDVLLQLTALEQEVVIMSSRLDDYEESFNRFLSHPLVKMNLSVNYREDIRLALKKAHYRIHLYKDLIESTSGLLSDSIDNKLNTIMEYLQTWALVISIPTLIFSLFGINTGGLIGRETPYESWIVILIAILLGMVTAWWLKKKEFK
ncbi:CorA family divalent cation transporter [Alkalibacterium sp. f15]|uniref:CorA family divalent cation transporter n=1 Tax=Alkalibacterium sp. f15 TaxID=3414029 RepID=UPI003BF8C1D9